MNSDRDHSSTQVPDDLPQQTGGNPSQCLIAVKELMPAERTSDQGEPRTVESQGFGRRTAERRLNRRTTLDPRARTIRAGAPATDQEATSVLAGPARTPFSVAHSTACRRLPTPIES